MARRNPTMEEDGLDIPASEMPETEEITEETVAEEEPTEETEGEETTTVPKSMFKGQSLKPGDEFYFTVVAEHGDEIEVAYSTNEKESMPMMRKAQSSMDKLQRY